MSIGIFIRERRKELNLTQEDLANRVGVTYQAVSKWETEISSPDIGSLSLIAGVLEVSIDELVNGRILQKNNESKEEIRAFWGNIYGNIIQDIHADVGTIVGVVKADIYGNVKGNIIGEVNNIYGNVEGNILGKVYGDITGYVAGNVTGDISGRVKGGVHGKVRGTVAGDGINVDLKKK